MKQILYDCGVSVTMFFRSKSAGDWDERRVALLCSSHHGGCRLMWGSCETVSGCLYGLRLYRKLLHLWGHHTLLPQINTQSQRQTWKQNAYLLYAWVCHDVFGSELNRPDYRDNYGETTIHCKGNQKFLTVEHTILLSSFTDFHCSHFSLIHPRCCHSCLTCFVQFSLHQNLLLKC